MNLQGCLIVHNSRKDSNIWSNEHESIRQELLPLLEEISDRELDTMQ